MLEVDEGSLKIALALFLTALDYSIEYDQNGNASVVFENAEDAFRMALVAYLTASELVEDPQNTSTALNEIDS